MDRKPFDAPGVTTSGDGDTTSLLPEARRAMFLAKLLASTAQVPVWRTRAVHPSGAIITTNIAGPVERVHVHHQPPPPPPPPPAGPPRVTYGRLVWIPEGFMITPRTPAAPNGYGMPPTVDGKGTPAGPLRQAIINRKAGNAYPKSISASAIPGNLGYMDWETTVGAGVMRLGRSSVDPETEAVTFTAQFSSRFVQVLTEPDSLTWRCHRPAYAPEDAVEARARAETNAVRAAATPVRAPLGPPLMGMEGELANNVMYQVAYGGVLAHNSGDFREGHHTFSDRVKLRSLHAAAMAGGENLRYVAPPIPYNEALAVNSVAGWASSPGHYASMVADWHSSSADYAWVEFSSALATITHVQQPPYDLDSPTTELPEPLAVRASAQVFVGLQDWVHALGTGMDGACEVGVSGNQDMFIQAYAAGTGAPGVNMHDPYVTFRGRQIYPWPSAIDRSKWRLLAACVCVDDDGQAKLRIAALTRSSASDPSVMRIQEGPLNGKWSEEMTDLGGYIINPDDASVIGRPRFSASGKKVVFSVLRLLDAPGGSIDSLLGSSATPSGVVGHRIEFVEFNALGLFNIITIGDITVTTIGFSGGTGDRWHSLSCVDRCPLIAAYDGETVVYAEILVEAGSDQALTGSVKSYAKHFKGTLIFPDDTEIVYADITMSTAGLPNAAATHGYFRHFLPFDILRPAGVAFVEYKLPADDTQYLTGDLVFQGVAVKHAPNPLNSAGPGRLGVVFSGSYPVNSDLSTVGVHRGSTDAVTFNARFSNKPPPNGTYPAALVSLGRETAPRLLPRGLAGEPPAFPGVMEYALAGPVIVGDGVYDSDESYQRVEQLRYAHYKGEFILAGRLESTLGPVGVGGYTGPGPTFPWIEVAYGAWKGEDQWYRLSSLDLPGITGLADLSQNILPIGTL